jgi:hypothetical protein
MIRTQPAVSAAPAAPAGPVLSFIRGFVPGACLALALGAAYVNVRVLAAAAAGPSARPA